MSAKNISIYIHVNDAEVGGFSKHGMWWGAYNSRATCNYSLLSYYVSTHRLRIILGTAEFQGTENAFSDTNFKHRIHLNVVAKLLEVTSDLAVLYTNFIKALFRLD